MPLANLTADLSAIFDAPGPAEDIEHTPPGAAIEILRGIFEENPAVALAGPMEVSTSRPMVTIRAAECTNIARDSLFNIRGVVYRLYEIQPENGGCRKVFLTRTTKK